MSRKVDRAHFYENFPSKALFGRGLTEKRKEGFEAIFDVWDEMDECRLLEWLAYAMATAWHETGGRMQPVREAFAGSDEAAFRAVTAYCEKRGTDNYARRHPNGNSYYGRGYVQLTHAFNYQTLGERLGFGSRFYDHPDEVMNPILSGRILLVGMIEGLFRPDKGRLSNYFNGTSQRWIEARELINGDKHRIPGWADGRSIGELVSQYAQGFRGALREM